MENKTMKFEHPKRVAELDPMGTLQKIGVNDKSVIFDYGAGTGVFAIPAAQITKDTVYAYDINEEMLGIIKQKKDRQHIDNITIVYTDTIDEKLDSASVDFVLLITVYHEIADKRMLFGHLEKLLNQTGKIAVVEFHYRQTPAGPPVASRVSKETLLEDFAAHQYQKSDEFDLGDNLYLMTFVKK